MFPLSCCTVLSVTPPTIRSHCRKCGTDRRFACAERFRANANGKLVDVWLLYRCATCDATRNVPVVERAPVGRIDRALLAAAYDNDARVARRLARDVGLLRRAGVTVEAGDEWTIVDPPPQATGCPRATALVLDLPEPLLVRLDDVVAAAVGTSRASLRCRLTVDTGEGGRASPRPDVLRLWSTVVVTVVSVAPSGE